MQRSLTSSLMLAGLLCGGAAFAADNANRQDPQERYRQEVAACNSGQTQQDKQTCLREAGAALQAARQGQLDNSTQVASYDGNALSRCSVFMGEELAACRARVIGHGTQEGATVTHGSVNEGGILRESVQVITIPAEPTAPAVTGGPVVTPLPPAN